MALLVKLLNFRNVQIVFRNIAKYGLIETLQLIFSDLFFDYRYKIETINTKMLDELEIDSPNKAHGRYYEGTNAYRFNRTFSKIKVDVANTCMIDFGSGKGKLMFLAAERGIPKIIGVEFSTELVDVCKRNVESFKQRSKSKTEFTVIHMDAAEYQIPAEANLLFFSNPFDEALIEKVIENILRSIQSSPREVVVAHLFPQGNMAFANHPRFHLETETEDGFIFRLKPAS